MRMTPEELLYWCEKLNNVLSLEKANIEDDTN